MQPRPSFDRELLIPIAVGLVAILGLVWIFLANDRNESPLPPTIEPTAIPFEVSPRATERLPVSLSATPTPEETETPRTTTTATSPVSYPGPPAETPLAANTLITGSQPASATPLPDQVQPLAAGKKYDDTDPNIVYDRYWAFKMNSGTKFAYKGTLHVSDSIGNEAAFRFTGQRFFFGYQRGRNFGIVTVVIDGQPYSFHEQAFDRVWRSPELSPGTHSVRIIHESGESINLDYIEVWD
jgi:hypothetical protein